MKKNIGTRLRELRGILSQSEFARKIGVKQTSYSGWESNTKVPAATVIAQISNAIGVSADWLLGLTDSRAGSAAPATDPAMAAKLAEKDAEIERLKGEVAGLRYALEVMGKKTSRSTTAPATAGAMGA